MTLRMDMAVIAWVVEKLSPPVTLAAMAYAPNVTACVMLIFPLAEIC